MPRWMLAANKQFFVVLWKVTCNIYALWKEHLVSPVDVFEFVLASEILPTHKPFSGKINECEPSSFVHLVTAKNMG